MKKEAFQELENLAVEAIKRGLKEPLASGAATGLASGIQTLTTLNEIRYNDAKMGLIGEA